MTKQRTPLPEIVAAADRKRKERKRAKGYGWDNPNPWARPLTENMIKGD